jgi:putative DNA primase/helicase
LTAEIIGTVLGGRKIGRTWCARCPAHPDRKPSLSIRDELDGKILVHCFAGCCQRSVIAALRARGLWRTTNIQSRITLPSASAAPRAQMSRENARRREAALAIWRASQPLIGTPVEVYLASRGIRLAPVTLRLHPALKHPSGGMWPAMIALVTRGHDGDPLAIHRTYLARDGIGKAPVEPQKMMLGPCRGGAVQLGQRDGVLMVGEGIETCLAAMQATGHPAWAALSTSGMRVLDLPKGVREVIVLADGDEPGVAAASDAALRWTREGRCVRIARPPQGMDFNDILVGATI